MDVWSYNKTRNDHIREWFGVAPITEKMVENRLIPFCHGQRGPINALI